MQFDRSCVVSDTARECRGGGSAAPSAIETANLAEISQKPAALDANTQPPKIRLLRMSLIFFFITIFRTTEFENAVFNVKQ
jgi:hypothetical protein